MTKKSDAPAIRFKGFSDAWEQRKLGELVDVCSGRDYKHLLEGTIPVYGTGGYMLSVNDALSYDTSITQPAQFPMLCLKRSGIAVSSVAATFGTLPAQVRR